MSTVQVTKNRAYALYLHPKQVLWKAVSKKYFSIAKDPIYISIFQNLYTLGLFKYHILQYLDKFIIYDFFATVIRFVWKAPWQKFFEQTPVLDDVIINPVQKEVLKPSAYNSADCKFIKKILSCNNRLLSTDTLIYTCIIAQVTVMCLSALFGYNFRACFKRKPFIKNIIKYIRINKNTGIPFF